MVYVTNTTLRASPRRVIRLGRIVFAILPARRKPPKRLTGSVPDYLYRDVGLPPTERPRQSLPPDVVGRSLM
ncbi:hypothetical protein [Maritimibacter sp. UBA3975]|uniref:hypothetical protein n=1 Tax=Maritimibacter sp. UBA3975 TaxID=1946833 RepID=UPI000C09E4FB|nr:hypothetical protein [Maritimibacter sp. UBA3975]MAM60902.1 hypothetical protein [Maritimibacter sp.]|tara:strand:+ start:637 stop:852 length:216 start_codon:yes stop_codon:yes gene_type:complete